MARFTSLRAALLVALTAVVALAFAGSASATGFSNSQTLAVPPASSFSGTAGGDGWDLSLSNDKAYQVFHHNTVATVACHLQQNAANCFGYPKTITTPNANGVGPSSLGVSVLSGTYLDQATGKLYFFASRSDSAAGVACFDTNTAASCGWTALTAANATGVIGYPANSLGYPMRVGSKLYAFNYVNGAVGTAKNKLLCFDISTAAACGGQPYSVNLGGTSVNVGQQPPTTLIGQKMFIPVSTTTGGPRVACFDATTLTDCAGAWPVPAGGVGSNGAPLPRLDASGTAVGVCFTPSPAACWNLAGASVTVPAGLISAIPNNNNWIGGPPITIGTRVYAPIPSNNAVGCYNYSTNASCTGFPKTFSNLSLLYTVNADPQRPTCLWVNADGGGGQIQSFDAFTGGACGAGSTRVLTSQFVVPQQKCYPTQFGTLQLTSPARSAYTSGTVQFADAGGNAITSIPTQSIDANGAVDLSGLGLSTANGLPQFIITLTGASGGVTQLTVKLSWTASYDPDCVGSGTTVPKEVTASAAALSADGQSGSSIAVPSGTSASDQLSLTGTNAAKASGTVRYTWYSDAACTQAVKTSPDLLITTPGTLPGSGTVSLPDGTYYVVAAYSGDAGNLASQTACGDQVVSFVAPDHTAPVTTDDAPATWRNTAVTVHLTATDDLTGVAATRYSVDAGPEQSGTDVAVPSVEGIHTIRYHSIDNAGNTEVEKTATVRIDTTTPTATVSHDAQPSGWNGASPVDLAISAHDEGGSGLLAAQPVCTNGNEPLSGTSVSGEGVHEITCVATDAAGNVSAPATDQVKIDTIAPELAVTHASDAEGWNNGEVALDVTSSDDGSGIAAEPACTDNGDLLSDTTVSGDGVHHIRCTVSDVAGHESEATDTVKIDSSAPVTTDDAPGDWKSSDVTVSLHATDGDGSGVATTFVKLDDGAFVEGTSVTVAASGNDGIHTVSYYSVDETGNKEAVRTASVRVDTTAPATTDNAPSGWTRSAVTVALSAQDARSGVAATFAKVDGGSFDQVGGVTVPAPADHSNDGVHTVSYYSVDNAGNREATRTATVRIDTTAPVVTPPAGVTKEATGPNGAAASYGTASAVDGVSANLSATCTPASGTTFALGSTPVTCSATDEAGNTGSTTFTVNVVDTTKPDLTVPDVTAAEATGGNSTRVNIATAATDIVDGSVAVVCTPASGSTFSIGSTSVTCTATDAHGNTATAKTTVLVYRFASDTRAAFVISDKQAVQGGAVTFWGSQWEKANPFASGLTGASSFKGFVEPTNSQAAPKCGGTWTASTGNSSKPPATVPAYMAVIVASKEGKNGSAIGGDVKKLVIVKTNAGYDENPGHAGTGTVVGTIC